MYLEENFHPARYRKLLIDPAESHRCVNYSNEIVSNSPGQPIRARINCLPEASQLVTAAASDSQPHHSYSPTLLLKPPAVVFLFVLSLRSGLSRWKFLVPCSLNLDRTHLQPAVSQSVLSRIAGLSLKIKPCRAYLAFSVAAFPKNPSNLLQTSLKPRPATPPRFLMAMLPAQVQVKMAIHPRLFLPTALVQE